ncbi:alpha/beta fold hydrolase [Noviherbaspirillum soli]|uniref:alpha/beta fold hydrolase n=1 Tax=Noviherbaspirillum soli TaxID=1064518 RepID=UPI00188DA5F2|nr:alpha/beta fold hydrolase [Noviherbaspirillum soli]
MTPAFDEGQLATGDGHRLWYAQYGNPHGLPLFWLHGGPGSGASLRHADLVDLARFRLVLADQRGCVRSQPAGGLENNHTGLLVDDIERLRRHLGMERMLLGGGSWGATLALAYAARHGDMLHGLVLRAPFLATPAELGGFFDTPQCWQAFAAIAPASALAPGRLLPWLAGQLASSDAQTCSRIAGAWRGHEQALEGRPNEAAEPPDEALVQRYRIQAHYLHHGCFLDPDALVEALGSLPAMPVAILHGDADRVCPPANARRLQQRLPGSRLLIVAGAGHDPFHPAMAAALRQALDGFAAHGSFDGWGACHG